MAKNKTKPMPKFQSIGELAEFFETHDMGDYWAELPIAQFDIDIKKRTHIVAIDADLTAKLTALAKRKRIPSEKLVNAWLREKLFAQR